MPQPMGHYRRTPAHLRWAVAAALLLPPAWAAPARADAVQPVIVATPAGSVTHQLALSAGLLAVASGPAGGTDVLRTAVVGAGPTVAVPVDGGPAASGVQIARSGRRGAYADPRTDGQGRHDVLLTNGSSAVTRIGAAAADGDDLQVSGPYTRVAQTVYDTTGTALASGVAGRAAALSGHRLVWADASGVVRVRDLELPVSGKNPRVAVDSRCSGSCRLSLAASAGWIALARSDAAGIDVVGLTGDRVATIGTGAAPQSLVAGDEAVSWREADALREAPAAGGAAVTLDTVSQTVTQVMDDDLIAWLGLDGDVRLAALPGQAAHHARVLGVSAAAAFSPNGDGSQDSWRLVVDATKPLATVTLSLAGGNGAVVRTIETTVNGSEATLDWNGAGVPDGVYAWTLTGLGSDSSGAVTGADGDGPAAGLVSVAAGSPGPFLSLPARSAAGTHAVSAAWGVRHPIAGLDVRYDVRMRRLRTGGPNGARIPVSLSGQVLVSQATATAAPLGSNLPSGSVWQVSVRAQDSAGHLGPWSSWGTSTVS